MKHGKTFRSLTPLRRHTTRRKRSLKTAEGSDRAFRVAERLRVIWDNTTDYAIVMLDLNGRITGWNRGAEFIFGYSEEEILGQSAHILFKTEDWERIGIEMKNARETGRGENERWQPRKDGSLFWASGAVMPLRDRAGMVVGYFKILRDLTRQKREDETLRRRAEELDRLVAERTSRLQETVADIEEFAYTVAHDLRAPLRAVEGYSMLVRKRIKGRVEPEIDQLLERISASVLRMDRMTQDVLTYGKISAASMTVSPVDLDTVMSDVLKQLVLPEHAEIRVTRPLRQVTGNAALLSQCISNLITNALKFVPEGRAPVVEIWTEPRHDLVRLWIKDNGIGIDPQYFEKIFKPFERLHAKESYEGMGIGLAIVKKAVERTGGHVGVESQVGTGSRFWIELPRG